MKSKPEIMRWVLGVLLLVLAGPLAASTTFLTVGCGGPFPNFTTLRGAFQWVETNYFPGDVDISICPGTYHEDAYITHFALTGPGHQITVHSSTANPADVTIRPATLSQAQVLRLRDVRNFRFEDLTFEASTLGLPSKRHVVRTQAGAGDIDFRNCRFVGMTPSSSGWSTANFSVVQANQLSSTFQFFNCEIVNGSMGIHVRSTSGPVVLNVQASLLSNIKGHGIRSEAPLFLAQIDHNAIICNAPGDWQGIFTPYGPDTRLSASDNTITTFGADRCHAIFAGAHEVTLSDNSIAMAEHPKAFGIEIDPRASSVAIADNQIDYPGMMYTAVRPDSFVGIQRLDLGGGTNVVQDHHRFLRNEIHCNGANEGAGIWSRYTVADLPNGLEVRENTIQLDQMGEWWAWWLFGILLDGNSGCEVGLFDVSGNAVTVEALGGYVSGGLSVTSFRMLEDVTLFNNVIQMKEVGTDSSMGLGVAAAFPAPGKAVWLGNNMVSLENLYSPHANGVLVETQNGSDHHLWHNSVHVFGPDYAAGTDAFHLWGNAAGGQVELLDNVFSNLTGGPAITNAVYTANWTASNGNDYYTLPGAPLGQWGASSVPNLAALQALTSDDLQSVTVHPTFASPFDLHLSSSSPLLGINAPHLGFAGPTFPLNWDIDGEGRSPSNNREIGADERGLPVIVDDQGKRPEEDAPFQVFPLPAQDELTIHWADPVALTVQLVDVQGRTVATGQFPAGTGVLDVSAFPRGTYLLRVRAGGDRATRRVILQ